MKSVIKKLTLQIQKDQLSHAYLFLGSLQEEPLKELFSVSVADFFVIRENPIKISHVRDLNRFLQLRPHSSQRKVAILFGIENMTLESANALLKILEEPPGESILFLQALKKERILPTVLSRCQIHKILSTAEQDLPEEYLSPEKLRQYSVKEKFAYVTKIAQSENLNQILNAWEKDFRTGLLESRDNLMILSRISKTRDLLLTNTSVKLLLENLLLDF